MDIKNMISFLDTIYFGIYGSIYIFVFLPIILLTLIYLVNPRKLIKPRKIGERKKTFQFCFSNILLIVSISLLVFYVIYMYLYRSENFMLVVSIITPLLGVYISAEMFKEESIKILQDTSKKTQDIKHLNDVQSGVTLMMTSIFTLVLYIFIKMNNYQLFTLGITFVFFSGLVVAIVKLKDSFKDVEKYNKNFKTTLVFFGKKIDAPKIKGLFSGRIIYIVLLITLSILYNPVNFKGNKQDLNVLNSFLSDDSIDNNHTIEYGGEGR